MKFVKIPNNPINASVVLIAKNSPDWVVKGLEKLGIKAILSGETTFKVDAVRCHTDTQICHIGDDKFVVIPQLFEHYKSAISGGKIIKGESAGMGAYPDDVAYNVANTGKFVIHNFKFTDKILLNELTDSKINISQGYAKCLLCIVDENSVITEDEGISHTLKRHNIDVLKISAGDVKLPGMNYGFLGGASGKIAKNKLAFAGDITLHRDYKKIYDFCMSRNVMPISISDEPLIDIGSIIPILEKE